jgi:hypothetical protein
MPGFLVYNVLKIKHKIYENFVGEKRRAGLTRGGERDILKNI